MSRVVVISGHPNLEKSHTNKTILNSLADSSLDIEIRRLDQLYPNYNIDVDAEQKALLEADIIVLQFPFYWYSVPGLLKKWLDDTLSYNFAYGSQGDKLKGKDFILSFTIGGPEESYNPLGYNHFNIEELIKPLEQTAYLTGMNYHPPVYSHRMVYIPGVYNTLENVVQRTQHHCEVLLQQLNHLIHSPEKKLQQFITQWFAQFDDLTHSEHYYLSHLSNDVSFDMPEGNFTGHQGFIAWYKKVQSAFKPNCDHQVEQIDIDNSGKDFKVKLRVRLAAETHEHSEYQGKPVNILVNETWLGTFNHREEFIIHDYRVTPTAN
ncbi:NAD(P)H-dependent oxidoreductase [Sessilibacter corallicola]|uniref:Flavodoxin-like fold domain-containing protein n=1 Tax=Sessilibacter corallicola TaxID=2904075 RepID=A0ABQ0A6W2_9GAMM